MSDIYKALADPTRRAILDELSERDGQTLFLESAGLVRSRREGRYKFHHLDTTPLGTIVERWRPTRGRSSR